MKHLPKSVLRHIGAAALFFAVSVGSCVYLFAPGSESAPIKITDRNNDKVEDEKPPLYIFVEEEKTPTLSVDELLAQLKDVNYTSLCNVLDTSLLSSAHSSLPGAGALSSAGYYTSDSTYSQGSFVLGVMPALTLPSVYSLRSRTVKDVSYEQLSDYAQFTAVYTDREEERPAIELYMGYLLIDNGESIDIYSNTGNYLMSFNDSEYALAYARDSAGDPLFYKTESVTYRLPENGEIVRDEEGERVRDPHEKEDNILMEGRLDTEGESDAPVEYPVTVTEEKRAYYKLSANGSYFVRSDYDEQTDSRGVNFDYPSYYGVTDSNISLGVETFEKFTQNIDGEISVKHDAEWSYYRYGEKLSEDTYARAYNFSETLGCVVTEGYYHEGGLYFVGASGNRAFNTYKHYNDVNADRYVIENLMPPISDGEESIGYYYYDHGYVRARLEKIDYWNYDKNNKIQVYSSEEVLIDTRGNIFPIPSGFTLRGYSDGVLLLEHNGMYGFMNTSGDWIAQPIYSYAEAFHEGLAVLKTADGRYGMIDTAGNIVLPFAYSHLSSVSDGIIAAFSDKYGWQIIRKMTV